MVEFISYDGKWPSLCMGTLKIKVDEKEYSLKGLISGGSCGFVMGWTDTRVKKGDWDINLDSWPELKPYKAEILKEINSNIPKGCCGGCL